MQKQSEDDALRVETKHIKGIEVRASFVNFRVVQGSTQVTVFLNHSEILNQNNKSVKNHF